MLFRASDGEIVPGDANLNVGMDFFWSVMPQGPPTEHVEFRRGMELDPRSYTVTVTVGSTTPAVAIFQRTALSPETARQVVDNGPLVATLFSSTTDACQAGVIVLGGSDGGVPEEEAAVLASHGFTTLALAYFGAPGLPRSLVNVPLESVERALAFMKSNGAVCPSQKIGILGASKGAELALVSASRFHDIGAVVAVSPSSIVFGGIGSAPPGVANSSWSYRGTPLPFANGAIPTAVEDAITQQRRANQRVAYVAEYAAELKNNTDAGAVIPVEDIAGPVLLVAGGSDELWPSLTMAQQVRKRLQDHHHPYADQLLSYSAAGHPIGVPFEFAKAELEHSSLALGGTAETNERASEDSWPKIVQFFAASLPGK
jgi:dienelactone hydrolase